MIKKLLISLVVITFFDGCNSDKSTSEEPNKKETQEINKQAIDIRNTISKDIVIAHRGTTYWAPEETEPAFRWARNIGADYLEFDLQMTKDSILVVTHDNTLLRTSNVKDIFPDVNKPTTNDFTLKELRTLDFGSNFNNKNKDRARESFIDAKIMTFHDVIMIAEGYQIKKDVDGLPVKEIVKGEWNGKYLYEKDPKDNLNRPGVYAETKKLHLEKLLLKELKEYKWLITDNPKEIKVYKGKVGTANTKSRIILQTFYKRSITQINKYLPGIPKCFLIWRPDMLEGFTSNNDSLINKELKKKYIDIINYCTDNNVEIIGSSITGKPNNYGELTATWMVELVHKSGMIVHPYTFDTVDDFNKYAKQVDGVFTNRADLALEFYKRNTDVDAVKVLEELGY